MNSKYVTEISADCFKESDAVTVLATYTKNTFDNDGIVLTLNANGGTLDGNEAKKYDYIGGRDSGASMSLLPYVPVREGYTFNGWNTKKDGSGKITSMFIGDFGITTKKPIANLIKTP